LLRRLPDGAEFYYDFTPDPRNVVTALAEDRDGRIWVGRASGVYALKPESFAEISSGNIPAMRNFDALTKVQPASTKVSLPEKPGEIFQYPFFSDALHAKLFYQANDGHLWISDGSRVADFDGHTLEVLDL